MWYKMQSGHDFEENSRILRKNWPVLKMLRNGIQTLLLCFIFGIVENRAGLTKAVPQPRQAVNQWNVQLVVPPNTQLSPNPPKPTGNLPNYAWVQIPISQPSPGIQQPQTPLASVVTSPPNNNGPQTFGPVVKDPDVSPGNAGYTTNLGKYCLQPRGQFSSSVCNKFVNCWDGVAVEQECPGGLVFNPKGYCDYPESTDCRGRPIVTTGTGATSSWPPSSTPSQGQSSVANLESNPTTVGVIPTTPVAPTSTPVDPALRQKCLRPRGQFPSFACNKYVNCWDDIVLEQECPDGLLFSLKGYCDHPFNVNCDGRTVLYKGETPTSECPLEHGTFRHKTRCSSYYTCIANKIVALYECPEGFNFNDNIGVCDYEYRVDCSKDPLIVHGKNQITQSTFTTGATRQSECQADYGTFRDSRNCSIYYSCIFNKIVAKYECPPGFSFSDNLGVCDYSYRVDCNEPVVMFQVKKNVMPEIPTDLANQINNCTPGSIYRLNPQCSAAAICKSGMAEIVQCPAGLAYDSSIDKCVLLHLAKC